MKTGIYENLSDGDYHGDRTHISSSQLKFALKNMNLYYEMVHGEMQRYDSQALKFGRAAHTFILEGDKKFHQHYLIFDDSMDMRTKAAKALKSDFMNTCKIQKKEMINESDFVKIQQMGKSIDQYPEANNLLKDGLAEVSCFYTHPSGLDLKVRPDYINKKARYILDLKTSRDASMSSFKKDCIWNYNYDLSAAMYLDGLKRLTGNDYEYYFLVVEKEEPFSCAVYKLGEETRARGEAKMNEALDKIVFAKETRNFRLQNKIQEI